MLGRPSVSLFNFTLSELCLTEPRPYYHIINIIIISDVSDVSDASCVLRRRRRSEETGGLQCLQSSVAPGLAQSLPGREHRETWLV